MLEHSVLRSNLQALVCCVLSNKKRVVNICLGVFALKQQ